MKYCAVIIDGAAGWPLAERGGRTCLELACTPYLDAMAGEGTVGLVRSVPTGMEPSSACACMSVLGYDPTVYFRGRAGIEARSMGIPIADKEVVFRCNLVAVRDGKMYDYSSGHIATKEAAELIAALNRDLASDEVRFYPGVSYRHLLKIKGHEDALGAICTPPHDIPGRPIADFLPRGPGSELLRELMKRSEAVLVTSPANRERQARGEVAATMIWLFWGSGRAPDMPPFHEIYGLKAALTSGVDLLRGLGQMAGMEVLDIPGVTDDAGSDHAAQVAGALAALKERDLVVIHIEAPDEVAHAGDIAGKIAAIQRVDSEVIGRLRACGGDGLRVLVMPDHPTPIAVRTHVPDPVPFLLWGDGFAANGARRFTEAQGQSTGFFMGEGYKIMDRLTGREHGG